MQSNLRMGVGFAAVMICFGPAGLWTLAVPMPVVAGDEAESERKEPRFRDSFARGKVLSVERHGDRFSVQVSIGADDGIQAGIETNVYIVRGEATFRPSGYPRNIIARGQVADVANNRATCNIGPTRRSKPTGVPAVGDTVVVRKKHFTATFVVAKNVIIHDRRIMDWNGVRDRLAELNDEQLIAPSLRFTQTALREQHERLEEFNNWCKETTGRSSSGSGSLSPFMSNYYDSITESQRVLRDASRRKIGVVMANGSPVAKAEIIVCTLDAGWIHEIYLENGQLRDPYSEPTRTLTELNGKFDIFPESDRFQVLVLHKSGIALVNSDQWPQQPNIVLKPWAQISGRYSTPAEFDERPHFESRFKNEGWAEIRLEEWNTPLRADRSFRNQRIPPGKIFVTRAIQSPRGGATSVNHDSFELAPGEAHEMLIGPLTKQGRTKARDYLRREGVLND